MFDHDLSLNKAKDLIDAFLDEGCFSPTSLFDVSERLTSDYLFRGQSNRDWSLLPTAHRSIDALDNFTPQPPSKNLAYYQDNHELILWHLHAELRAVQLFLEAADSVGIATPLDYNAINDHNSLFNNMLDPSNSKFDDPFPSPTFLSSMAMAQHYGVPTRLLDWSQSPLIAAYFAAKDVVDKQMPSDSQFSVICLSTKLLRRVKSIKYVTVPSAHNRHLNAQRGAFTLITNANQYYVEHGQWPSIESTLAAERDPKIIYTAPVLIRLSLPNSEATALLKLLYLLGISELTIRPSLQSAADNLAYKLRLWPNR